MSQKSKKHEKNIKNKEKQQEEGEKTKEISEDLEELENNKNKEIDQVIEENEEEDFQEKKRNEEVVRKRLEDIRSAIKKEFGKDSIYSVEDQDQTRDVISTGSIKVDSILGNGGIKKGKIMEIYGPESSGKTTLALNIVKSVQEAGGIGAYIDVEHAMDLSYAEKIGVKTEEMLLSQPHSGESALEILSHCIDNQVDVVVIDSVAALVPKAEIDGEIGDSHIGLQARLMTQGLKIITGKASKNKTIVIFINQVRFKVGVMFGNPETTPGGNALKFACSYRLEVKRKEILKTGSEDAVGNKVSIKCSKNKCGKPFMTTEITIDYNKGISILEEIVSLGVDYNIIQKSGSWYSLGEHKLGQGVDSAVKFFKEKPELGEEVRKQIEKKMGIKEKKNQERNEEKVEERLKQVKEILRKKFGKESVFTINDVSDEYMAKISTGSLKIDCIIGGGLVKGRIVEIYGPESSGKTTLALHMIKSAQDLGGIAAFIDVEHALDLDYAEKIGVKIDELLLCQPNSGEEALALVERYGEAGVDVIILDSVAALATKAELEGDVGDVHVGLQARMMGQALRKLTSKVNEKKVIVVFINQIRSKIGGYGNPETTPGGNALKFSCSMRLDVRKREVIKGLGEEPIGNKVTVKCVKNKVAAPFKETGILMYYNQGINLYDEILHFGVLQGLIEKSGAWYSINGEKIGQGAENVWEYLKTNRELFRSLTKKIRGNLNI